MPRLLRTLTPTLPLTRAQTQALTLSQTLTLTLSAAQELVAAPTIFGEDGVLVGSKAVKLFAFDPQTGQPLYWQDSLSTLTLTLTPALTLALTLTLTLTLLH